jgi:hypothetical protein
MGCYPTLRIEEILKTMNKEKTYRLVSDYGYGDKTWLKRDLTEAEAMAEIQKECPGIETLEQALNADLYYLEEDSWDDEEDWDWMDS